MPKSRVAPGGRARAALLLGAVVLTAFAGPPAQAASEGKRSSEPAPRAVPKRYFGVNGSGLLRISDLGQSERLERHLEQVEKLGVSSLRVGISWADYDYLAIRGYDPWRTLDRFAAALARHDLRMLAVPRGAPPRFRAAKLLDCLDRDRSAILPAGFPEYGRFVGAIVDRYGRAGSFWSERPELPVRPLKQLELWNEPNWAAFWCPSPDPAGFAQLAAAGAAGAQAADPSVELILGGLVTLRKYVRGLLGPIRGVPLPDFLARVAASEPMLTDTVDAVGVHLYERTPAGDMATLAWAREAADAAGFGGAEIAITEFGWNRRDMSGAQIAANYREFVAAVAANEDCRVGSIAAHAWITRQLNPLDPEDWWGIADPWNGDPYPAARAYREAIASARGGVTAGAALCA